MSRYFDIITCAYLVAMFGCVEGNKYRRLDMRVSVIEQRVNENNYAVYDLQDAIKGMNTTMNEFKNTCTKEACEDVPKATTITAPVAVDPRVKDSIIHAFQNEKSWVRQELSNIKRQAKNLTEFRNVNSRENIESLKQSFSTANIDRRMDALEERLNATWQNEINILKRSIHEVEKTLLERIEIDLSDVANEIKEMDTKFTSINVGISTLSERLVALERYKNQQVPKRQETLTNENGFLNEYMAAVSGLLGNINGAQTCETNWKLFEDFCYQFRTDKMPFDEALKSCIRDNAYLVDIQSQTEDVFIDDLVNKRSVWLGSNKKNTWMRTSSTMDYTNWWQYERFLEMRSGLFTYKSYNGRWRTTTSRGRKFSFVCKKAA